ncbi:MAG: o-succinylbenzoate synthase [Cytophagales bacterium]|nr:MAG: o-succinylbenzoate synthase [Cytophagales bacterium]
MALVSDYLKYTLQFRFEAGTSRGVLTEKDSYIVRIYDTESPELVGLGECGPLKGLSYDDRPDFEERLAELCQFFNTLDLQLFSWNVPIVLNQLIGQEYPSILFGFETAMLDYLSGGKRLIVDNDFARGLRQLPINGLIWMGDRAFMERQIEEKIAAGFTTLKLKIGALDFEQEIDLLTALRERFTPEQITLRVDANGAFAPAEAMQKLTRLAALHLHSIEQPIRAGQHELMADLCQHSPLPIALDEELVGHMEYVDKFKLLKKIQPQFVVLKPTLLGGLRHADEWIELANRLNIGWWVTSALESNVGLNAIAQYTAKYRHLIPQGLGTGQLYYNNFDSPLLINGGQLTYEVGGEWKLEKIVGSVQ